jgi:hypothetical protein
LKLIAKIASFFGQPLLVLTYLLALMLAINPFAFGVLRAVDQRGILLLISVFTTSCMIPGLGVALMKPLGLVQHLSMRDKQERIGPYIICGVFYLWLFKNFMDGSVPLLYATFALGATIGLFLAFFINIFLKISAHTMGMGALVAMVLTLTYTWPGLSIHLGILQVSMNIVLCVAVLLAGLVGYSLLLLGAHSPAAVWRGYAAGMAAVLLANVVL